SGPNQNEVVLYVYTKVDTITTDSDTVTVTLSQTISLPLVGGVSSGSNYTSMAANKQFLFFGTRLNPEAVEINKRTFSVTQFGGFSPPINIFGITANDYGYVTLSFGPFNSSNAAFIVVGPDGSDVEDVDGSQFMLNTDQAIKVTARSAGISRPAHAGISDPLRGRRFRGRHDQKERVPAVPAGAVPAATPIDATLYTRYHTDPNQTIIDWNVCGSLPDSSGCYGSGSVGPFGRVGALMEGEPTTNRIANTVTRAIYVLDSASGPNQNEVVLYVYTKVDTITTDSDTVTVTLSQTISLPLVGDFPAQTSMAANKLFLYIGTDLSPNAVQVDKRNFTVTQIVGFPPITLFAITANPYGYVTLSFGSFGGPSTDFIVVGPDGSTAEDGGGSQFMLNTLQAVKVGNHAGITTPLEVPRSRRGYDQNHRVPAAPAAALDAGLYAKYNMDPAHTTVNWNVCGSLPGSSGCYGSGSLGPSGRVGALME